VQVLLGSKIPSLGEVGGDRRKEDVAEGIGDDIANGPGEDHIVDGEPGRIDVKWKLTVDEIVELVDLGEMGREMDSAMDEAEIVEERFGKEDGGATSGDVDANGLARGRVALETPNRRVEGHGGSLSGRDRE
jgi:hypothetical protein